VLLLERKNPATLSPGVEVYLQVVFSIVVFVKATQGSTFSGLTSSAATVRPRSATRQRPSETARSAIEERSF